MGFQPHYLLDFIIAGICTVLAGILVYWTRELPPARRFLGRSVVALLVTLIVSAALLATVRTQRLFPADVVTWVRCFGIFAGAALMYGFFILLALRSAVSVRPDRRRLLKLTATAAVAAPAALAGFAIARRNDLVYREIEVRLPTVTPDLDGLRIVQLSDIHLSPFVPASLLERAVDLANDTRAHLAVVTGDLITMQGDPLDACLTQLSRLKADAGIFGCMGNHEIYARSTAYTEKMGARLGMRFLRGESVRLQFGNAPLAISGVDYQRRGTKYLDGAERLAAPGAFNVLLSHNPDVFPVAAEMNFDLTISGHTHGGQVNFELVHPALNIVNFVTPFVYGLYENSGRSLYVTRGVGTIGVPARLGAPPEVVLIRLCAT